MHVLAAEHVREHCDHRGAINHHYRPKGEVRPRVCKLVIVREHGSGSAFITPRRPVPARTSRSGTSSLPGSVRHRRVAPCSRRGSTCEATTASRRVDMPTAATIRRRERSLTAVDTPCGRTACRQSRREHPTVATVREATTSAHCGPPPTPAQDIPAATSRMATGAESNVMTSRVDTP